MKVGSSPDMLHFIHVRLWGFLGACCENKFTVSANLQEAKTGII